MNNLFRIYTSRPLYEFVDDTEEIIWLVTYYLPSQTVETDDSFEEDKNTIGVEIEAPDFESAAKYAQQYIITKQKEDGDNAYMWVDAEIISIHRR